MSKKIIFSSHALLRMKERFISERLAVEAIHNPDKIEKSDQINARVLIKKIYFNKIIEKNHLLMAICEIFPEKIEVITIIDTSKISKYF